MKIPVNAIVSIYLILAAIKSSDVKSQTPNYREPGSQKRAVLGEPSSSTTTTRYRNDDNSSERKAKEAEYNKAHQKADDAWDRQDYQEALRLYLLQQQLRDGPNVREMLNRCRQMISNSATQAKNARDDLNARSLWAEGNLAIQNDDNVTALAKFKQAMITRPEIFNKANVDFVSKLEAYIKSKNDQKLQDQTISNNIQQNLQNLAATLNLPPVSTDMDFMSGNNVAVNPSNAMIDLPPLVETAITKVYKNASPEVKDRVRKGVQGLLVNDYKVAKAWFEDALFRDPNNPGLKSFIAMCNASMEIQKDAEVVKDKLPARRQLNIADILVYKEYIRRVRENAKSGRYVKYPDISVGLPQPQLDNVRRYFQENVFPLGDEALDNLIHGGDFYDEFIYDMQTGPTLKPKSVRPPKLVHKSLNDKIQN